MTLSWVAYRISDRINSRLFLPSNPLTKLLLFGKESIAGLGKFFDQGGGLKLVASTQLLQGAVLIANGGIDQADE